LLDGDMSVTETNKDDSVFNLVKIVLKNSTNVAVIMQMKVSLKKVQHHR